MAADSMRSPLAGTPNGRTRRSWFFGTPHKKEDEQEDVPILKLTYFTKKVMLCFDNVLVGKPKTRCLRIENPCDFIQTVYLEKFPFDKGFNVADTEWELQGEEHLLVPITWCPIKDGNVRELVTFKFEGMHRLQIILIGTSKTPPLKKKKQLRRTLGSIQPSKRLTVKKVHEVKPAKPPWQQIDVENIDPAVNTNSVVRRSEVKMSNKPKIMRGSLPNESDSLTDKTSPPVQDEFEHGNMLPTEILTIPSNIKRETVVLSDLPCSPAVALNLPDVSNEHTSGDVLKDQCNETVVLSELPCSPAVALNLPDVSNEHTSGDVLKGQCNETVVLSELPCSPAVAHNLPDVSNEHTSGDVLKGQCNETVVLSELPCLTAVALNLPDVLNEHTSGDVLTGQCNETVVLSELPCSPAFAHNLPDVSIKHTSGDVLTGQCNELQTVDIQSNEVTESFNLDGALQKEKDQDHDENKSMAERLSAAMNIKQTWHNDESSVTSSQQGNEQTDQCSLQWIEFINNKKDIVEKSDSKRKRWTKTSQSLNISFPVQKSNVTSKLTNKRPRDASTEHLSLKKVKTSELSIPKNKPQLKATAVKKSNKPDYSSSSKVKSAMKGVAMPRLKLKKAVAAIPRHPMPFAAKNMFYDERWLEKQERGFVKWLNYILTPDDYSQDPKCKSTKVDAAKLFMTASKTSCNTGAAPTKEVLSLRTYSARRRMTSLRRGACSLFQSEPVVRVLQKIESEVERGGLEIRKDKHVHADYGIKQNLLNMMLSYNPLWLRIGLETIYGEMLPIESNADVVGLSRFIVTRLLTNPDIAAEFAHPTVPALFRQGYEDCLNKFILKKLLMLVFFLDRAKLTRLIDHNPCLFCKDSEFKSNRKLLLAFSRDYLKGEGDVTKHLSFLGYCVTHTQTPLDEFDFAVTNLAADLRCGVRLARIVELLIRDWKLSHELRVPAISRLQKIHNMEVAFKAIKNSFPAIKGSCVDPKAIVDGHREKTLQLLWTIIFHLQIGVLLNKKQLKDEIAVLKRIKKVHATLASLQPEAKPVNNLNDSTDTDMYFKNEEMSLLLQWCKAVCSVYNLQIDNFTVSFSDGRALCYLIHHYHPTLLPFEAIQQETTQQQCQQSDPQSDGDNSFDGTWKNTYSPRTGKSTAFDEQLENERANYKLLFDKVKELGGVPLMVKCKDMVNTIPDEKVVMTYVCHLCVRLLDLHQESSSARVIQSAWKLYKMKKSLRLKKVREDSAVIIQRAVCRYLTNVRYKRRTDAAVKMQTWYRCILAKKKLCSLRQEQLMKEKQAAAKVIQIWFRCHLSRKHFVQLRQSTILLQAAVRGYQTREYLRNVRKAAVLIQTRYRSLKCARQIRQRYIKYRTATVIIQASVRGHLARKFTKQVKAARLIQAAWRGYQAKSSYLQILKACVKIQSFYKGYLTRKRYTKLKHAAVTIQKHFRCFLKSRSTRNHYLQLKHNCIVIQSAFREMQRRKEIKQNKAACIIQATYKMYIRKIKYTLMKQAALKIQTAFRGYLACRNFQRIRTATLVIQRRYQSNRQMLIQQMIYGITRGACITIQSAVRAYLCRRRYKSIRMKIINMQSLVKMKKVRNEFLKKRQATLTIQCHYRSYLRGSSARQDYNKLKSAAVTMQALFRMKLAKKQVTKMKAATKLQAFFKMILLRNAFYKQKLAAIKLQAAFRRHHIRQMFQEKKQAAILVQSAFRGFQKRKAFQQKKKAAILIQTIYRGYQSRKMFQENKKAAILIQSIYRGYQSRKLFQLNKKAAILIQNIYRGYQSRKVFQEKKTAVILIQTIYRGYQKRKLFQENRKAAILIQSIYRGYRSRKVFQEKKKSAILIQTIYRGYQSRKIFQLNKKAAILIQSIYRGYQNRKLFQEKKTAATLIQTIYRGYQSRKLFQENRKAAIVIQSVYRGYRSRKVFQEKKKSAILIQTIYRGYRSRKMFNKSKEAAILIQSIYRGSQSRKLYKEKKNAAILIQSIYRGYRSRKVFQEKKNSAIFIQTIYRGYRSRKVFHKSKEAAILIQSFYRGYHNRKVFQEKRNAAILIQSFYRGYHNRKVFQEKRNAAILIQSIYRGYQSRKVFQENKKAAILIQTIYRGYRSRKMFHKSKEAAILIQSIYRGYHTRKVFQDNKNAAIVIQSFYRGYQIRKMFLQKKNAAILVQTIYRGYRIREMFKERKIATILIQSTYRGYRSRKVFQKNKKATILIQSIYRGNQSRKVFREKRNAAILIQSFYRGYHSRKVFQANKNAAILIQSVYRGYKDKILFQKKRKSAVLIQSVYRGYADRMMCQQRNKAASLIQSAYRGYYHRMMFQKKKKAAILIQSVYRCYQSRTVFVEKKESVILIQSIYRGYWNRKMFLKKKAATIMIQSIYRGYHKRKMFKENKKSALLIQSMYRGYRCRKTFLKKREAAILIQTVYRGHQCKTVFQNQKRAAILIQSFVRKWISQKRYNQLKRATLALQTRYRAKLARDVCYHSFQKKKKSAILLQSCFRRHIISKDYQLKLKSLIRIQACIRAYLQRKVYLRYRGAVITIQKRYRAKVKADYGRFMFLYKRGACIVIQSHVRGFLVRSRMRKLNVAASCIQAAYRCHRQVTVYKRMQNAAVVIQTHWRAILAGQREHQIYLRIKNATVVLQRMVRRYQAAKTAKKEKSAIIIQSNFKMYKQRKIYSRILRSVKILQAHIRCYHSRQRFLAVKSAVSVLQIRYRSWKFMKDARLDYQNTRASAVKMQALFRCNRERKQYLKYKSCTVSIQAMVRCKKTRKQFLQLKQSVVYLQCKYRALMKCRSDYVDYHYKRGATIIIQSAYRGWIVRNRYQSILKANITLQAATRGYIQRKLFKKQKNATICLQSYFQAYRKGNMQRKMYILTKASTVTIQRAYRQYACRKYERRQRAATTIQAFYRCYRQQQDFIKLRASTIQIQSLFRCWQSRRNFLKMKASVEVIQRQYRSLRVLREYQNRYQSMRKGFTRLQAVFRGQQVRQAVRRHRAATCIQSWFRMCVARRLWQRYRRDVVQVQAVVRGWQARRCFALNLKRHRAALCLQRTFNKYMALKRIKEAQKLRDVCVKRFTAATFVNLAAIRIQRSYRCFKLMTVARQRLHSVIVIQRWVKSRLQYMKYCKCRRGIVTLQRAVREHQQRRDEAAITLQSYFRMYLVQKQIKNMDTAALHIQAVWRGYIVRKKTKSKKLVVIRGRCIAANKEATEEKRLCNRTATALDYIMRYKQVSQILEALRNLDVVTRLSAVCCERLVEGQALPVIFVLIKNCNRSLPCLEVVKYCISILTHLAKYKKTCIAVYETPNCVMFLIELMQMYREKPKLFVSICNLLTVFCHNSQYAEEIRRLPRVGEKIQSIHLLTRRKHKLAVQRTIAKNRSLHASFLSMSSCDTPVKRKQFLPDWDLSCKPCGLSEDPLAVIEGLMKLLHLRPK